MQIIVGMKSMTRKISDLTTHVIFTLMCAVMFIGQTLIYLIYKFNELAEPFEQNQAVWEHVISSIKDIWGEMLIWPALVFVLLAFRILSLRKLRQDEWVKSFLSRKYN